MSLFDLLSAPFRRRSRLHPALMGAPGPSPWFMWGKPNITLGDRSFAWKAVSKQGELAGIVALMDGERGAHVVLDFGCYVQPLTGAKLLIWTVSKAAGRVEFLPIVRFAVYDLSSSSPLPNLTEAARQVRHGGLGFKLLSRPHR